VHGPAGAQGKEGEKDGKKEGGSTAPTGASFHPLQPDQPPPPDLRALIREELRQALTDLHADAESSAAARASAPNSAPARRNPPAAPPDQPPLADHPLDLWGDLYPAPRAIDLRQLAALAGEHDQPTGGYGAYWTSKAILAAALVNEQPGIRLVKAILDRWRAGACYGSDAPAYERKNGHHADHPLPATPAPAGAPEAAAAPEAASEHDGDADPPAEAVALYRERFGRAPNPQQAAQIAETVHDLTHWAATLDEWRLNGWKPTSVGHMLDHYQKRVDAATPLSPLPFIEAREQGWIDTPEYSDWIGRFRGTAYQPCTPTEQRAVLTAFTRFLTERQAAWPDGPPPPPAPEPPRRTWKQLYHARFGPQTNLAFAIACTEQVKDLDRWEQVLDAWVAANRAPGWDLLDAYQQHEEASDGPAV
jgi:hypothetical protein